MENKKSTVCPACKRNGFLNLSHEINMINFELLEQKEMSFRIISKVVEIFIESKKIK